MDSGLDSSVGKLGRRRLGRGTGHLDVGSILGEFTEHIYWVFAGSWMGFAG